MSFDERVDIDGLSYYIMGHYDGCRVQDRIIGIVDPETGMTESSKLLDRLLSSWTTDTIYGKITIAEYLELTATAKYEERIREDME